MKKISLVVIIMALLSFFTACQNDEKKIQKSAYGYLNAVANYNIDEAMPFASKETREITLPFLRDRLIPITDKKYIESNTPATIVLNEYGIENDTAVVSYTKTTPIATTDNTIQLIREDGDWKVDVKLNIPQNLVPVFDAWDKADSTKQASTLGLLHNEE